MKVHVQAVPLSPTQPAERLVKRGTRSVFRLVRRTAAQAGRVPGLIHQAATDVRDAWQESADPCTRPNA